VIFFRDQHISPAQQVAFTRRFGEIEFNIFGERWSVPGNPEIVVVSNVTEDGRAIGVRRAGENWHSDMARTCMGISVSRDFLLDAVFNHAHSRGAARFQQEHQGRDRQWPRGLRR
jgi:alpha-ketoglutarate-dependent taurine dioxygenase